MYAQLLTQLAGGYEFIMEDNGSSVQLRIKVMSVMLIVDWLNGYTLS